MSAASSSSSSGSSVSSLAAAAARWSLSSTDLPIWRARMVASQSTPAPAPSVAAQSHQPSQGAKGADPQSRQQFLDELKLKQMAAEERLARLRSGEADDDEEDEEEDAAEERGDQKHAEEDEEEAEDDDEESSDSEEEVEAEGEYENELDYYVHELLCVDAISHDPPTGKEEKCPYCVDGKKFESEFACSTCAFVRGVCTSCRRIVVLRQLEDSKKGASICLALLSDPALLARTFELDVKDPDEAEEADAIREQITFMLDAYFNKE